MILAVILIIVGGVLGTTPALLAVPVVNGATVLGAVLILIGIIRATRIASRSHR